MIKILIVQTPFYDYSSSTIIEGLHCLKQKGEDIEFYCVENSNYAVFTEQSKDDPEKMIAYNYKCTEDFARSFGKYSADLIITTSNTSVRKDIVEYIARRDKTIFIDGEDKWENKNLPTEFPLYFKREMRRDIEHPPNVRPFPFGAERRYFRYKGDWSQKRFTVSCMFGPNDKYKTFRVPIEQRLKDMKIENSVIGTLYGGGAVSSVNTGNRDHKHFYDVLAASKVSVDAHGAYECTTGRMWEALANCCCLLIRKPLIYFPETFMNGIHWFEYETEDGLELLVRIMLDPNNEEMIVRKTAEESFKHLLKYHTTEVRAKYLLDCCREEGLIK
mgnify:CR=1 FL=1